MLPPSQPLPLPFPFPSHLSVEEAIATMLLPAFEFPRAFPPSIVTAGLQGKAWRKNVAELSRELRRVKRRGQHTSEGADESEEGEDGGEEDEDEEAVEGRAGEVLPSWVVDCVWRDKLPPRDPPLRDQSK